MQIPDRLLFCPPLPIKYFNMYWGYRLVHANRETGRMVLPSWKRRAKATLFSITALKFSEQTRGLLLLLIYFIRVIILLFRILFWILLIQGQMAELQCISIIPTESIMCNNPWVKPLYVTHWFWRLKWSFTDKFQHPSVKHCFDPQLVVVCTHLLYSWWNLAIQEQSKMNGKADIRWANKVMRIPRFFQITETAIKSSEKHNFVPITWLWHVVLVMVSSSSSCRFSVTTLACT